MQTRLTRSRRQDVGWQRESKHVALVAAAQHQAGGGGRGGQGDDAGIAAPRRRLRLRHQPRLAAFACCESGRAMLHRTGRRQGRNMMSRERCPGVLARGRLVHDCIYGCQARVCGPFWWCSSQSITATIRACRHRPQAQLCAAIGGEEVAAAQRRRPEEALYQPAAHHSRVCFVIHRRCTSLRSSLDLLPGLTRPNWRSQLISAATSMQCFECQLTDAICSVFRTNKLHWVLLCWCPRKDDKKQ